MFTDLVGYTAMAQRNESLALELLERHNTLLRSVVKQRRGREAFHVVSLLQEPVYLLSGLNFPVKVLGSGDLGGVRLEVTLVAFTPHVNEPSGDALAHIAGVQLRIRNVGRSNYRDGTPGDVTILLLTNTAGADGLWNRSFEGGMAEWNSRTVFRFSIVRDQYSDPRPARIPRISLR